MEVSPAKAKKDFHHPDNVRETLDRLTDEEWATLDVRLRRYIKKHYGWIPGLNLEGLIQDAKEDVYIGIRRWRKGKPLMVLFIEIIDSRVSHGWEKESIELPGEETSDASQGETKPRRIRRRKPVEDIDELALNSPYSFQPNETQRRVECKEIFDKACEIVCQDRILIGILKLKEEDPKMTLKEMAERLDISMEEIWNAQRRLDRKLSDLRKEWLNVEGR